MLSEDQIRQFREDGYVIARGALPWTTGTSSSPSQAGTLLRRHMAGFYSAVDKQGAPQPVAGLSWSAAYPLRRAV